jgi:hypothetical protein
MAELWADAPVLLMATLCAEASATTADTPKRQTDFMSFIFLVPFCASLAGILCPRWLVF